MNKYETQSKLAQESVKRLRACERKKAFKTQEQAAKTGNDTYRCQYCNMWHTTSAFKTMVNRLKRRKGIK